MGEHDEFIADFLEECDENLDQLDQELVALEEDPRNEERLRCIFRNVHTIKGSSGFFGFSKLGALAHEGEGLLGKIRDGELGFSRAIASGLLQMADAVREILAQIEQTGSEGDKEYIGVTEALQSLLIAPPSQPSTDTAVEEPPASREAVDSSSEPKQHSSVTEESSQDPQDADDILGPDASAANEEQEDVAARFEVGTEPSAPAVVPPSKAIDAGNIRVDVGLLDELMDFAGELVLARNALFQCSEATENPRLAAVTSRVSQITTEIQDRVTRTRMQPIGAIWGKFRRIVRDLSVDCGKQVRLELVGEETELDRSLLEAIRDPLTHLIRNGVDHGIESPEARQAAGKPCEGLLRLWARHESGQVIIEASDDGGGIDVEQIRAKAIARRLMSEEEAALATPGQILQCIFEPGFSTAQTVSAISGRGVGMDVVRSHIERIGGSVQLRSKLGAGTTLTIKIPLTLAIVPALMIASGGQEFVIPQAGLLEVMTVGESNPIERLHDVPVCRLRDRLLPLLWLDELLGISDTSTTSKQDAPMSFPVAVVKVDQFRYGIVIDEVLNTHEIVVKSVGVSIKSIGAYAAATILGDGSVSLILDIGGIAKLGGLLGDETSQRSSPTASLGNEADVDAEATSGTDTVPDTIMPMMDTRSLLVCEIGEGREIGIPLEIVERLEELPIASIQQVESGLVASYRGGVLPLRSLHRSLGVQEGVVDDAKQTIPVVVHRTGERLVGAAVERVIDIVDVPRITAEESDRGQTDPSGINANDGDPDAGRMSLMDGRVVEVVDLEESR